MVNRFVIVFCVALTLRAQSDWQSLAHAGQLTREGQFDEARRIVQSSVDQPPGSAGVAQLAGALNDLGALCQDLGSNRDASWYYLKSVSLWNRAPYGPGFTVALVISPRSISRKGAWERLRSSTREPSRS